MTAIGWDNDGYDDEACNGTCCTTTPAPKTHRRPGLLTRIRNALRAPKGQPRTRARVERILERDAGVPSFTCPRCSRTSYHPQDKRYGYCGACHDYTGAPS